MRVRFTSPGTCGDCPPPARKKRTIASLLGWLSVPMWSFAFSCTDQDATALPVPESAAPEQNSTRPAQLRPNPSPPAIAYGAGGCGKLTGGVALPCTGSNYEAFTPRACRMGRNHVHPLVQKTILRAYEILEEQNPTRHWQYGDLGFREGGPFAPHRTHQNGLSADFFVPVTSEDGSPQQVPISDSNRYGYGVEFDEDGRVRNLQIDWPAVTEHLFALEAAGKDEGVRIKKILMAPGLRRRLIAVDGRARHFETRFNRRGVWVRHDEHYHVDFDIPESLREPLVCD